MEQSLDARSSARVGANRLPRPLVVLIWALIALFLVGLGLGAFLWFASIPGEAFDSSTH